jgi:hypothetical protein
MPTRIALLALLSAAVAPALSQVPTSAAVMRIDPATQRQRDQTRAAILQDELVAEALALLEAQKQARVEAARAGAGAAQEATQRVVRHRQNISALAKELATTERQSGAPPTQTPREPTIASPQWIAEEWLVNGPAAAGNSRPMPRSTSEERRLAPGVAGVPEWLIPAVPGANGR